MKAVKFAYDEKIQGQCQKVAVDCWFTATGRMMPQMLKYMDEEGCLHTVNNIHVKSREKKHFAGISSQQFKCSAVLNDRIWEFVLLFNQRDGVWDMILQ